ALSLSALLALYAQEQPYQDIAHQTLGCFTSSFHILLIAKIILKIVILATFHIDIRPSRQS
ncbi:MAG: hypothetical protein M1280_04010, partial [Actinobacteria bacterium]|nr:hypothetical protein [Actinomycetota bacterium]